MGGYAYGEHEPTENCPYCGTVCRADFVDIGVGFTQCGPYHCEVCRASEIGPYDKSRQLSADEERTGWYGPDSQPGSSANVIGGRIVGYVQARETYRQAFSGNPLWHDKAYVDDWWEKQRNTAQEPRHGRD
mgnify:CR=1 FL=1